MNLLWECDKPLLAHLWIFPEQMLEKRTPECVKFLEKIVFGDVKTSALKEFLKENRGFGRNLGLIIDECSFSKEQTIETDNGDISELFPYLDMICITLSVGGQMECKQGHYNNSRPLGFRRYVLTLGYRSSSKILRFSSTVLHEATW